MKTLLKAPLILILLFLSSRLAAQEDYKKYMSFSYGKIDTLMYTAYSEGAFDKAIPYMQAGLQKAKLEFGEQDSVFATYCTWGGFLYEQTRNYKEAELLDLQAVAIRKKILGEVHPNYAISLNNLAVLYKNMGLYSKAEPLFIKAMAIRKKVLGAEHPEYASSLNNLADLYLTTGDYSKSEFLFLQAMAIWKKVLGEEHPNYAISLNNLALLYADMENYTKAEPLYLETLAIWKKVFGAEHPNYATSLNNLAALYVDMENYKKAEPLYLEALTIWEKVFGTQHPDYAASLTNLGDLYVYMGKYDKTETLFLEAIAILKKVLGTEHRSYASSLNNLAVLHERMGNYSKAEPLYQQTSSILKKALGAQHPDYASNLNNLASLYERMEKLDSAFHYCRLSLIAYAPSMDSSFTDWENLDTFSYTSNLQTNRSIRTLLSVLQKQYKQSKDVGKLETRYVISQAAIRLNERFRNNFTAEGEKLRVLAANNQFVLAAIETGMELKKTNYEATSFNFAEMNKGILLLESVKTGNAQQFGGLPDTLAEQEKILQKEQSELSAKLLEKRSESEKDSLRRVLNGINQEVDIFTKMLKSKYPKYAALKYGNKIANVKEIQALLDDKTALLEYLIGDSVVYIFYVDKKQVKVTPIYLSNKVLNTNIKTLHQALSDYKSVIKEGEIAYQKYTENAYWFYQNLVHPALKHAEGIQSLIIVPDGELGHLPFETFLTKPAQKKGNNYKELSYLFLDYKISYNYAATLWKSNKETAKNKNNGQLMAMASNYELQADSSKMLWRLPYEQNLRAGLRALPAARQEVETLAKSFKGFFAFDSIATEKVFKEKAGEYAIIHLAMHGLLDKKNPILSSLAFTEYGDSLENNFLQAYEISKMELNADLVVLSACETGFGKFETGNGTASLARAFMYAGVPALVVSLWQVNDASTSIIMQAFYKNLAKGMDKAEALQKAKLEYIKMAGANNPDAAHPAFWAAFVLLGDSRPIKISQKGDGMIWWIAGGGLLAAAAGSFFVFYVRKNRKNN